MENLDHMILNGRLMTLFLAVYDTGSVNGATQQLDLNQSTVSYGLEKLREVFKDPLFVKSGRGIMPTERAKALAPRLRELVVEMELLTLKAEYDPSKDEATVAIAANIMELLPYMNAIRTKLENLMNGPSIVFLELGSRENIDPLLSAQAVDLVVSVRPTELSGMFNFKPIFSFKQVCYYDCNRRQPINSVEEYCSAGHAVLDFGGVTKSTIDHTLAAMSMSRQVKLSAPNIAALAALMKGTDLISTMQVDLANHSMSELSHCNPPFPIPDVNFDLIWHRRSEYSGRNIWLRNLVHSTMTNFHHDN